jgi:hypothetical protein
MMRTRDWSSGGSVSQTSSATSRLRALQRGIRVVLGGYLVALLVGFPAAYLWLSSQERVPFLWGARLRGNEDAEVLGLLFACGGVGLGYFLVVVGQWICLFNAPQSHGAKELAYVCVLLALLVGAANVAAFLVGGTGDFDWLGRLLRRPLEGATWTRIPMGGLLQVLGGLALFGNILTFTQLLRALLLRAHQEKRTRRIQAFSFYLFAVVGASVGMGMAPAAVRSLPPVLPGFVLAWLLVLGWHAWLILGASSCAREILSAPVPGAGSLRANGKVALAARLANVLKDGERVGEGIA